MWEEGGGKEWPGTGDRGGAKKMKKEAVDGGGAGSEAEAGKAVREREMGRRPGSGGRGAVGTDSQGSQGTPL